MRRFVVAIAAFGLAAVSANASLVCVTPQEMKVLQSAALQQQLMVAALTCHMSVDYNRFVTAYRGRLVQSDQALKAFFTGRARGENYDAYKTRIANRVSLRSLRDPRFCDSAQKVFDVALGRGGERNGLAPEPPQLIDTGYEGCRNVEDKLIEAEAAPRPAPRPETKVTVATPAPRPAVAAPKPAPTTRVQVAALPPPMSASVAPKPAPRPHIALAPKPAVLPPARLVELAEAPQAKAPAAVAVRRVRPPQPEADQPETDQPEGTAPERFADADTGRFGGDDEDAQAYEAAPPPAAERPRRYAAVERPQWNPRAAVRADDDLDADDPGTDDHVPNAYRAGSVWVGDAGPAWRPAAYYPPPRWRHPPHRAHLVLGPDGRWMVVIGRSPRWERE